MTQVAGASLLGLLGGGAGTSLLSTQYGFGSAGVAPQIDPYTALRLATKNRTREVAVAAKQPETLRDITAFRTAVGKADRKSTRLNSSHG